MSPSSSGATTAYPSQGGEERKSPNGGTAQGEEGTHPAVAKPSNLHPLSTLKQPQKHPHFLVKENNEPRAWNLSKPPVHIWESTGTVPDLQR